MEAARVRALSLFLSKKVLGAVQSELAASDSIGLLCQGPLGRALEGQAEPFDPAKPYQAIVVDGLGLWTDWEEQLSTLLASLGEGGRLVCLDKGSSKEVSRRLLCGGLSDLRQRQLGRRVLTTALRPV